MSRQIGDVPTRTFNPGDVIFKEGDDAKSEAFLIHQGKVEIRKNLGGEEKLLRVQNKGELLGEFALFRNIPRSATAIAGDAVTLMVIPANRLDAMVRTNPGLAMAIIKDLVSRMLAAEDRAREAEERTRKAEERAREAEERARKAEGGGAATGSA
jgi:CRP/FNR family cyclic AMP-dependent transcriptional regulator